MTGYHIIMNLLKISPLLLLATGLVMTFIQLSCTLCLTKFLIIKKNQTGTGRLALKKDQIMFFQSAEINYTNISTLEKNWNKL